MATSLAAQLAQIAVNSKNSLDIKAQKAAHSKSLIYEPRVAAGQTLPALYTICRDGFEELCQMDERFVPFGQTLFHPLSQDEDRTQMTAAENAELDKKVESFLRLCGSKLRLLPAIKSLEWLVRRFRIHEYNTSALISTFLPYHAIPAFVTLLSILPSKLPHEYRFLIPYIRSLTAPPRAAIVQHATQHFELLQTLSAYTLAACRSQQDYAGLVSFWGGVFTEAASGMLDSGRSGRASVQAERDQTLVQQIGPILAEALVQQQAPGVQVAAYMAIAVVASKASLSDGALSAFMEQLVVGWTAQTVEAGLVCLAILAHRRSAKQLSRKVAKAVLKVPELAGLLVQLGRQQRIDKLASGLVLALTERLAKKGAARSLPIIQAILLGGLLQEKQQVVAFKALLVAAHGVNDEVDPSGSTRRELGATLTVLLQAADAAGGAVFRRVLEAEDVDMEELELKLEAPIRPKLLLLAEDTEMADDENETRAAPQTDDVATRVKKLASLRRPASCLHSDADELAEPLCQLLVETVAHDKGSLDNLDAAPLLGRAQAVSDAFYLSFCMRAWSGPHPTLARVAALEMATKRLSADDCANTDFQAVLPYCITALGDPAVRVRRAAAGLLAVLKNKTGKTRWAAESLYSSSQSDGELVWLAADARASLADVVAQSVDSALLDATTLSTVLRAALDKHGGLEGASAAAAAAALSSSGRQAILAFLASHAVHTPLLSVKVRLLGTLDGVRGSKSASRTQLLQPVLTWWASLDAGEASSRAAREAVDEAVVDSRVVDIVLPSDKEGLECLFRIASGPTTTTTTRAGLLRAVFARMRKMWPALKDEARFQAAQQLMGLAQRDSEEDLAAEAAADLLSSVELSSRTLAHFLDGLQHMAKMAMEAPAHKRRRTSSSGEHSGPGSTAAAAELKAILRQTTFVLQLIEGSQPATHPELLPGLFVVLSDLQTLRSLVGSELGYLQQLVLECLLAMMPAYQANKSLKIDTSVGHGDVLVSCIHTSTSRNVQSAALLLVASLARTAPEVVLHSVMPIFTLMGSSVLRQNDDYSARVVHQTIREVIPPLIETFKRGKRNVVASAVDLLTSFVIAYEHIPSHRKQGLFLALVEHLGPDDFLSALLAMLADRYGTADTTTAAFLADLLSTFAAGVQLHALLQLVALVQDVFQPKPALAAVLLGKKGEEGGDADLQRSALRVLTLLPTLLANRPLQAAVARLDAADDDMEAAKTRELYAQLLEALLSLADTIKTSSSCSPARRPALHSRCGDALAQLLSLQSMAEFLKAVETLLDRPSTSVRHKVLRALEVRVDREPADTGRAARAALLAFLPQLTAVIRDARDVAYKHTAITCVDKIADKYGRRDLEAVAAAAAAIAGDACLGQPDRRLRVMALLCLASLVDVLQEAIVPVLPVALPRALDHLQASLAAGGAPLDAELHNAALAFVMALAQHLPYMLTGAHLDRLLASAFASAETAWVDEDDDDNDDDDDDTDDADDAAAEAGTSRMRCLRVLAQQVDAKVFFEALQRSWPKAVAAGETATFELVQILTEAIDKQGKAVAKNLPTLAALFRSAWDLRRELRIQSDATQTQTKTRTAESPRLGAIEDAVNAAALRMVLKLRDAAFRPVFADMLRWCDRDLPQLDVLGRSLRQRAVYGFLLLFFDRLKGAVSSYAVYLLDGAPAALRAARVASSPDDRALWLLVLRTLTACFAHDAVSDDAAAASGATSGFWQTPAHFAAVAPVLVEQFARARDLQNAVADTDNENSRDGIVDALIPAVVQLAKAARSADHLKELNTALLKRLASPHPAEKLAVVRCQQALAEEGGEEWLALLPEMLPLMSEMQDDDNEQVQNETHRWIHKIEAVLGENLDAMLQ